jgi:predicted dehydrogenase
MFLGPAPSRPYNPNRHKYNWHWFWDTGNGDIGNQGIHELDYARWGLNQAVNPKSVYSGGGKYVYDDDQQTPNIQTAFYDYGKCELSFEVRGMPTGEEGGMDLRGGNFVGVMFFGDKGYMVVEDSGFKILLGDKRELGDSMPMVERGEDENMPHVTNFLEVVRSRKREDLVAEVHEGVVSADLVHMANVSYRTGRKLTLEPERTRFAADDAANSLLARHPYRAPYVVS